MQHFPAYSNSAHSLRVTPACCSTNSVLHPESHHSSIHTWKPFRANLYNITSCQCVCVSVFFFTYFYFFLSCHFRFFTTSAMSIAAAEINFIFWMSASHSRLRVGSAHTHYSKWINVYLRVETLLFSFNTYNRSAKLDKACGSCGGAVCCIVKRCLHY